jgi:hypothetical protein
VLFRSKDVIDIVKFFQKHYDKVINNPLIIQSEKEEILIKLKRIEQMTSKYTGIQETSGYHIGYIYATKGDLERAKKYLLETLEMTSFSNDPESLWMKSKILLLELYQLEGEF